MLTLDVDDLEQEHALMRGRGLDAGALDDTTSDKVLIVAVTDPEGNAITLVEQRQERNGMRNLVVTENITLDGVIDATEGWFDVSVDPEIDQTDMLSAQRDHQDAADAVLMGRVTFEEMRGYWPLPTTRPASPTT